MTAENVTVLKDIPINITTEQVTDRVAIRAGADKVKALAEELLELTRKHAVPKAVYRVSVARNDGKRLFIDDTLMLSYVPLLRFDPPETVFPYVATCGSEIDDIGIPKTEFLRYYILNVIKELLLFSSAQYLKNHLVSTYGLQNLTHIGPGEAFGPMRQQGSIFSIIGDVENLIGVRLSPHHLIIPEKSTSGMFFETTEEIERCVICPQAKCTARRHPYTPEVLMEYRKVSP